MLKTLSSAGERRVLLLPHMALLCHPLWLLPLLSLAFPSRKRAVEQAARLARAGRTAELWTALSGTSFSNQLRSNRN